MCQAAALCPLFPPYVVLEIVDWLPLVDRFAPLAKIRIIERVAAAVRRVRARTAAAAAAASH